jgi:hypothetical protein
VLVHGLRIRDTGEVDIVDAGVGEDGVNIRPGLLGEIREI